MKQFLLVLGFLGGCLNLFAQIEFEFSSYEQDEKRRIFVGHEDDEGNYIIPITIERQEEFLIEFVKIDSDGEVLLSASFEIDTLDILINQFFISDDEIVVLGISRIPSNQEEKLWVGKFDNDFLLTSEQFFNIPENQLILLLEGILENDNTLVIGGVLSGSILGIYDFSGKLYLNNNTSYFNLLDALPTSFANDIITRKDSIGYVTWGSSARFLDSTFQLTREEVSSPIQIRAQGAILSKTDSTLLLSGQSIRIEMGMLLRGIVVGIFDYSLNSIKHDGIYSTSEDTLIDSCVKQSIEQNEQGNIFLGGTYHIDEFGLFESTNNSAFLLAKYDSDLNKLWQKYYGLDSHYYYMSGLIATSDEGCLMYGHRYTEDERWEAIAIKVNENGTITNTTTLKRFDKKIELFPNPFSDVLQLKSEFKGVGIMDVLDLNGRVLLSLTVNDLSLCSISFPYLQNGVYFYVLKNETRILQRGKFIKQR